MSKHLAVLAKMTGIDEGALPESAIITLMYLDSDGREKVQFGFVGESDMFRMMGALQVLTHKLVAAAE